MLLRACFSCKSGMDRRSNARCYSVRDDLTIFECAAVTQIKHLMKNPIAMNCGHCICRECLPEKQHENIKCNLCGLTNTVDRSNLNESIMATAMIEFRLDDLFKQLQQEYNESLYNLKNAFKNAKDNVSTQFDEATKQIETRIKELKASLDSLGLKLSEELAKRKNEIINNIDSWAKNVEETKAVMKNVEKKIEKEVEDRRNFLNEGQEVVNNLKQLIINLNSVDKQIDFEISKKELGFDHIAEVMYPDPMLFKFRNGIYKFIKTNEIQVHNICVMPPNHLLAAAVVDKLYVYDENMKEIKVIKKEELPIEIERFHLWSVCTNMKDRVYVSNIEKCQIYCLNLKFELIGKVGSKGCEPNQFYAPYRIYFHMNKLYVCDLRNKRIQVLEEDLTFNAPYLLDFEPSDLRIIKNVACISSNVSEKRSLYFYELDPFTLKHKYENHDSVICVINSYFYDYSHKTRKLYCYNQNGTLNSEITLILPKGLDGTQRPVIYFMDKLIIYDTSGYVVI